jgi:hypothetical protein
MERHLCRKFVLVLLFLVWASPGWTKESAPTGVLAASAGEVVVLADPQGGWVESIETGPVAWVFPAPGGTLFAPDLVHGRTTVLDLRTRSTDKHLDGITMPHFGSVPDRYFVVGQQILEVSYPERALISNIAVTFEHPWQVEVLAEDTVLMVLERLPDGAGGSAFSAVNLTSGRLVYRRPLGDDIRHFALAPALGVVALANATSGHVMLVDPATLAQVAAFPVSGTPVDLVITEGGATVVVAVDDGDGGGSLLVWKIKSGKKGLERKKEWTVALTASPVRLALSPDGRHVAVGLASAEIQVVEVEKQKHVATVALPEVPRDVAWCDPTQEGPTIAEWTDEEPPSLDLGGIKRPE